MQVLQLDGPHIVTSLISIPPGMSPDRVAHRAAVNFTSWQRMPGDPPGMVPGGYTYKVLEAGNMVDALVESSKRKAK